MSISFALCSASAPLLGSGLELPLSARLASPSGKDCHTALPHRWQFSQNPVRDHQQNWPWEMDQVLNPCPTWRDR
jgi:hypothetical protein